MSLKDVLRMTTSNWEEGATTTTTTTAQANAQASAGALMAHPAWVGHHTDGSRSKPTVHPALGGEAVGCSPTPQLTTIQESAAR